MRSTRSSGAGGQARAELVWVWSSSTNSSSMVNFNTDRIKNGLRRMLNG
jgi:hypothetical protein